jgi:PAT family beta-lactamase induction signal transducer AmpG
MPVLPDVDGTSSSVLWNNFSQPKILHFLNFFRFILHQYTNRRVLVIGCIAYANGLPYLLTASTLGVWLKSYGLTYTSIGLFGLLHLPYACKFLWAPLLDHVPLPFLKKALGQRRSWLCLTQLTAIGGLWVMAFLDPVNHLVAFCMGGFLVTISAASQHVLLLAYQRETLNARDWGIGEGMSVFAYRMAILTGGAGALCLADFLTWQDIYIFMAFLMFIGVIAVLGMGEADLFALQPNPSFATKREGVRYAIIGPFKDFMAQKGWMAILIFMALYRLPEHLWGTMQVLFLLDLGFTLHEVATVAKTFGLGASILGSFIGGYWIRVYGYKKTLFWGTLAHGAASLLFLAQAQLGANIPFLYLTIGIEHFLNGASLTAFFSYQLTCVSITFAATQLALLTSFANFSGTLVKPLAGLVIDAFGWAPYLVLVVLASIPGILWVYRIPFSRP